MIDGRYFCGLQIDYQEAVIRCVHAGFAEKNNALKVRKNLREEEAARVRFYCCWQHTKLFRLKSIFVHNFLFA